MLLDVFRELGLSWSPYGYEDDAPEDLASGPPKLDPIDVAGQLNRNKLTAAARCLAIAPLIFAALIICDTTAFDKFCIAPGQSPFGIGGPTAHEWLTTAKLLAKWDVLEPLTHVAVLCFATIFTVAKGAEKLRFIVDCRPLNAICNRPPPVCLPSIIEVLAKARHARVVVLGDLRHFFHQIGLPVDTRRYFGVRVKGENNGAPSSYFRCKTLPMGFAWSPYLAQAVSLTMLLHTEPLEKEIFKRPPEDTEKLPTYIPVIWKGREVGFACVVYDNYCVFLDVDDPALTAEIARRLVRNARLLNISWKELHSFRPGGIRTDILNPPMKRPREPAPTPACPDPEDDKPKLPVFLGVEIDLSIPPNGEIRWRHAPKRKTKLISLNLHPKTRREVAMVVGSVIWDGMVRLQRLGHWADIIDPLTNIGREIKTKRDWDSPPNDASSTAWLTRVQKWHEDAMQNPWTQNKPVRNPDTTHVHACSDAASFMGGVELLLESYEVVDFWQDKTQLKEEHIFIREVLAAVRTVKWLAARHQQDAAEPLMITILVDNIPARRALERGYSSNRAISRIVHRMWMWADATNIDISFMDVDTKLNAADCLTRDWSSNAAHKADPSHGKHGPGIFCEARLRASVDILRGVRVGRPSTSTARDKTWKPIQRFDIPTDAEISDDDELDAFLGLAASEADDEASS